MASTDLESASGSPRPQVGPLPRKRGEIGYQESTDVSQDDNGEPQETEDTIILPARHPADTYPSSNFHSAADISLPVADTVAPPESSDDLPVQCDKANDGRCPFLQFFQCKGKPLGVPLTLILRFVMQFILFGGTIAAWVIVARKVMGHFGGPSMDDDDVISGPASIFVHITFGIATLAQLLYLERCLFLIRVQRYAHTHRSEELSTTQNQSSSGHSPIWLAISLVPWNRPPLPTYAAALAESNPGTGDVEDLETAIPSPPAYGNTRDSTLLLANLMRNSRTSLPREGSMSRHSSAVGGAAGRCPGSQASQRGRPASLMRSQTDEVMSSEH